MENLRVITTRRHSYCGKVRQQGEEYYVDNEKHLKFLVAIKKVRKVELKLKEAPAQKKPEVKKAPTERKGMRADKPRNTYQRKDVRKAPENKGKDPKNAPVKNADNTKKD